MVKFTKLFCVLVLCLFGMASANAKVEQVHATFENPSNTNTTWTPDASGVTKGTFTWSTTYYNQLRNIGLPTGDITKYKKLVVDTEIKSGEQFRILIYKGGSNLTLYASNGVNEFILADTLKVLYPDTYNEFLLDCTEICLSGNNAAAPGEAIIKDVYLETYNDEGEKVYATFESPSNTNTTWTPDASGETAGTFTWSTTYYNQLRNIGLPSGDISGYKKLVVDTEIKSGEQFRILIYKGGSNLTLYASNGVNEFILADTLKALYPDTYNEFLLDCTEICLSGNNAAAPGEAIIKSVYLETYPENEQVDIPDIVYEEDPGKPAGDFVDLTEAFPELQPRIGLGTDGHPIVLGNGDVVVGQRSQTVIADLSAYSKLTLVTSPNLKLVLYMNHEVAPQQNAGDYAAEDAGKYVFMDVQADENGLIEVDLTQFDKQDLNCICLPWDNSNKGTVWYILLTEAANVEGIIPNGEYYVMSAEKGSVINAEGALDAKGAPITFTFNAAANAYTIAGADFFSGKQWTIADAIEGLTGYYTISTTEGFLAASEANALEQIADGTADAAVWILLQKAYWEDIVNSTYTVAGTANLTGSDWAVEEANQMTYNEETKLYEITYKNVIVTNDIKPEFKVVKTPMEGEAIWYPEGDGSTNWVITPDYLSGEGEYDITITFDPSDAKEIGVSGVKIEDIKITPENGADIYEVLIAAEMNKKPRNITIELAPDATYTVSGPLTAYANFEIQGNGATIDASGLDYNLIQLNAAEAPADGWNAIEYVSIHYATVKGLKKALFYSGCKNFDINWLTIDNSIIELAADATTIDFTKGSVARNFNVENSTIYAPTATTKSFYSSQQGQKANEIAEGTQQSFIFKSSTFYNLAPTKNFFSHRQSNQTWMTYDVQNNIFVNCGKSGQTIKGMNGGSSGKNPTWIIKGNAFNFDGADTSAAEATGDDDEPVQESVAGVVTFADAANGNFNGEFALAEGAEAPAALGDPRWTLTFKVTSELMAEAEALAADKDAVAVGKLIAAIDEAKTSGDESNLQAAVDQFKADNADQEKDETAKVATNGWKNFNGEPAGVCATQFAPAITTYDGRTANLAEVYEQNDQAVGRTGTIIYQDITGLENGTYKVGFYGNAFFTDGRGMTTTMEDGATDVAYVFANEQKEFIVAKIATSTTENNFRQFDVEVTDGTIKLGMGKEQAGTNWHTMQIYQLTWFATAKEVFAQLQEELKTVIAEGEALLADVNKTTGKDALELIITSANQGIGSNMINITELENLIGNVKFAITDFKKANWYIDFAAGEYYVIDAESGLKMAAGHDWGTRGIINEAGLDLTLTPYTESRTVTFNSRVYNNENDHFLGSNLYMDSSEWGWALEYQGFGFYILNPNNGKYINIDLYDNLVESDTPREWIIVSKQGVRAQLLEEMAEATKDNPVDATGLIVAPNFNRNDARNAEAWSVSEDCTNKNLSGGNNVNNCAESYHSTFTIMQTISGAPAGLYQLTAQGFYRQDEFEGDAPAAPVFFANEVNGDVPLRAEDGPNGMDTASEAFTNGLYTIEPINFEVKEDGMMYIGITASTNTQWVIWDNFQLKYFGATTTGITTVNATVEQSNNGIYNLNGQKVQNLKKGLFIINGKKVIK